MQVNLLYSTPNSETLIERCARICYRSESKTTPTSAIPLIRGLLARGHESVIEHSRFVVKVDACDREILDLLLAGPHLKATQRKDLSWIISGNARGWRDAWANVSEYIKAQLWIFGSCILFGEHDRDTPWGDESRIPTPPHTTIDQTANVELWALHIPECLSREELLAHGAATVYLHGVSRALTHQLVRHRMASFSMASQRYCKEDGFEYVTPPSIINGQMPNELGNYTNATYDLTVGNIRFAYDTITKRGIPKEDARYILPNAACTEIAVTMTLEHWQHFLELRCDKHAQWEIRGIAEQIKSLLQKHVPQVFEEA